MKKMKCTNCDELKEEIDFEYLFFGKKYEKICKDCKKEGVIIKETFF